MQQKRLPSLWNAYLWHELSFYLIKVCLLLVVRKYKLIIGLFLKQSKIFMKKIYTALFSVLALTASAQTITRENLPYPEDVYSSVYVNNQGANWNAGGSGDLQTWDFSGFTGDVVPFTYATANSATYTSAQMKLGLVNLGDSYFAASQSDYQLVGVTTSIEGFNVDVPYYNPLIMFKFPMMYMDSFKDTAYSEHTNMVTFYGQQINALTKRTTHSETTVDGRGTLKLANKTYDDVLRVKIYASVYDTAIGPVLPIIGQYKETVFSTTEEYYFFSQDYKHQLAYFMKVDTDAQPEPLQFIFTFSDPVVLSNNFGLANNEKALVYPNPASSSISVNMQDAVSIEIFDLNGNAALTSNLNSGLNSLDITTLKSGFYNYRVVLKSGEVQNGKLTVK